MAKYSDMQLFSQIDGTQGADYGRADAEHWSDLARSPLTEKQRVSLAEAGLIRYFQPEHDDKLKHLLPKYNQWFSNRSTGRTSRR